MSNTIAHLAVAKEVLSSAANLVVSARDFYLGSLAPDTIGSKPDCTRDDKKRVHLREGIRDADWLSSEKMQLFDDRIRQFVHEQIQDPSHSAEQRDFNTGYLVHLLTDKWNHKTIRQTMLKIANQHGVQENDREFFHMMVNDLEALDHYLLCRDPNLRPLFFSVIDNPRICGLAGYIEPDYLKVSILWWKNRYLPGIESRKLLYITEGMITEFVSVAAKEISAELNALIKI